MGCNIVGGVSKLTIDASPVADAPSDPNLEEGKRISRPRLARLLADVGIKPVGADRACIYSCAELAWGWERADTFTTLGDDSGAWLLAHQAAKQDAKACARQKLWLDATDPLEPARVGSVIHLSNVAARRANAKLREAVARPVCPGAQ